MLSKKPDIHTIYLLPWLILPMIALFLSMDWEELTPVSVESTEEPKSVILEKQEKLKTFDLDLDANMDTNIQPVSELISSYQPKIKPTNAPIPQKENSTSKLIVFINRPYKMGAFPNNPLSLCPKIAQNIQTCELIVDFRLISQADAIVFPFNFLEIEFERMRKDFSYVRPVHQKWVFFQLESPKSPFNNEINYNYKKYKSTFNETMTYRLDSTIPYPYDTFYAIKKKLKTRKMLNMPSNWFFENKKFTALAIVSNCMNKDRINFIENLSSEKIGGGQVEVHKYGSCFNNPVKGYWWNFKDFIKRYKFILAIENSKCKDYITEKFFHHAYLLGLVPVVSGPPRENYEKLMPKDTFIHVDDFKNVEELGKYLNYVAKNDTAYREYFNFRVRAKEGGSEAMDENVMYGDESTFAEQGFCKLCEKLWEVKRPSVIDDLDDWWYGTNECV